MRPLALTTAARACDGGPRIAIDVPGGDPKVSATMTASQPQVTSAVAPAILLSLRNEPLVIIEVLDARALCFKVAVDINQALDASLQTGPAKPGFGVEAERKQIRGILHVELRCLGRDDGDEDFAIARDLGNANAFVEQAEKNFGKVLVSRRLHQLPLWRQRADRFDPRVFSRYIGRQRCDHEHDIARLVVTGRIERLLDQAGVTDLDEIFRTEREAALPCARDALRRRRDRHQPVELFAEWIFEPGDGVEERGVILQHRAGIVILRRAFFAPDPFEHASDGVFVETFDRVFGGIADADDVDHRLDLGAGFGGRRHRAVDGAKTSPEAENVPEIIEVAFAGTVEETPKVLERVDDVPFGKGEVGVVELAAIALLIDRGQRLRRSGRR